MAGKRRKRCPWSRRHVLKLFEKIGVKFPEKAYRDIRKQWVGEKKLPTELKAHMVVGGAVWEWLQDLAQIQLIRCVERKTRLGENCPIEMSSSSTLPHLATDIGAILTLCREGYDVQARNLLRSFIEKIDLLICLRLDEHFATSYLASQSPEKSRDFFYQSISGGKLNRKARKLFQENFAEADFIYELVLGEWRTTTNLMLASAAHANHSVAMISLFPNLGRGKSQAIGLGGHPTNGSNLTIAMLLTACMPLHFLFLSYPYEEVLEYLREANVDVSRVHEFKIYHGLLLAFPLVDQWLRDLPGAIRDFPSES